MNFHSLLNQANQPVNKLQTQGSAANAHLEDDMSATESYKPRQGHIKELSQEPQTVTGRSKFQDVRRNSLSSISANDESALNERELECSRVMSTGPRQSTGARGHGSGMNRDTSGGSSNFQENRHQPERRIETRDNYPGRRSTFDPRADAKESRPSQDMRHSHERSLSNQRLGQNHGTQLSGFRDLQIGVSRNMTYKEGESLYVNTPIHHFESKGAQSYFANGNTEPQVMSNAKMFERQPVGAIQQFDKAGSVSPTTNPNATTQGGSSVLNTFIMNHERKKESQREHKPRDDQTKERSNSNSNNQPYCSQYARRREEERQFNSFSSQHANTAEANPRRIDIRPMNQSVTIDSNDATNSYRHVRNHLSKIISKMDASAADRAVLERGRFQKAHRDDERDTYLIGAEASATTPTPTNYGKRVSSLQPSQRGVYVNYQPVASITPGHTVHARESNDISGRSRQSRGRSIPPAGFMAETNSSIQLHQSFHDRDHLIQNAKMLQQRMNNSGTQHQTIQYPPNEHAGYQKPASAISILQSTYNRPGEQKYEYKPALIKTGDDNATNAHAHQAWTQEASMADERRRTLNDQHPHRYHNAEAAKAGSLSPTETKPYRHLEKTDDGNNQFKSEYAKQMAMRASQEGQGSGQGNRFYVPGPTNTANARPFEARGESREKEQKQDRPVNNSHNLKLDLETVKGKTMEELNCFKTVKITERSERSEQTNAESKLASIQRTDANVMQELDNNRSKSLESGPYRRDVAGFAYKPGSIASKLPGREAEAGTAGSKLAQLLAGPAPPGTATAGESAFIPKLTNETIDKKIQNLNATNPIGYKAQEPKQQDYKTQYPHTELHQARQKCEKLEQEIAQNADLVAEHPKIKEELAEALKTVEELKAKNTELETQVKESSESQNKLQDEVKDLRTKLVENKKAADLQANLYEFKLAGAGEAFKDMVATIQKDVGRLDALVSGKFQPAESCMADQASLEEKINSFNAHVHKQLSKTFVNKLETKISMYKIVHQKMGRELKQTQSELEVSLQKSKDYNKIVQEMSSEVKTLQTAYKDLMAKQVQLQESHKKQIAEIQPQVNSENLLKVINLIETFQNQHKQQTLEIKELNSEVQEKDEEIDRLKKVIIMQERIREKIQKQFHGGLAGGVSKWLDYTLDDAPPLDVHMNGSLLESIVSARESKAAETPLPAEPTAEAEATEPDAHNESIEQSEHKTEKRDGQSTSEQPQQEESVEVPLNSMKDILDEKMDQITSLKMENAKLQKGQAGTGELKKLQDKLKKAKKYEQFYEKQRAKKFRNCGCQIDMTRFEKKNENALKSKSSNYDGATGRSSKSKNKENQGESLKILKQALHGMQKEKSTKGGRDLEQSGRSHFHDQTGDEISFNKALSSLLDSSLSQCDGASQISHSESEHLSQIEEDISVNLAALNPLPTKYIQAETGDQPSEPHHSHSKSSATIFQYTNEDGASPSKGQGACEVKEKDINTALEQTDDISGAVVDKFLAKQMAATEAQHTTQVLQQENLDAHDGGYQESSFYEDISNLSYIKDFQKS